VRTEDGVGGDLGPAANTDNQINLGRQLFVADGPDACFGLLDRGQDRIDTLAHGYELGIDDTAGTVGLVGSLAQGLLLRLQVPLRLGNTRLFAANTQELVGLQGSLIGFLPDRGEECHTDIPPLR
jgi:hypothetical protein